MAKHDPFSNYRLKLHHYIEMGILKPCEVAWKKDRIVFDAKTEELLREKPATGPKHFRDAGYTLIYCVQSHLKLKKIRDKLIVSCPEDIMEKLNIYDIFLPCRLTSGDLKKCYLLRLNDRKLFSSPSVAANDRSKHAGLNKRLSAPVLLKLLDDHTLSLKDAIMKQVQNIPASAFVQCKRKRNDEETKENQESVDGSITNLLLALEEIQNPAIHERITLHNRSQYNSKTVAKIPMEKLNQEMLSKQLNGRDIKTVLGTLLSEYITF